MTIIHTNGLHRVRAAFCGCSHDAGVASWQQAIRQEWYPATLDKPKTFATFNVLNTFHKMTLEGKSTTYDFYSSLEKLSNNVGKLETKVGTLTSSCLQVHLPKLLGSLQRLPAHHEAVAPPQNAHAWRPWK